MSIIREISAIMMAMVILLATTGFSLHKHHCTITKETTTSVVHVKSCCGTNNEKDCPKGCCQDETEYIHLNSEIYLPAIISEFTPEQFVAVMRYCLLKFSFDQEDIVSTKYLNYRPPLLVRDIQVLVLSFLI
jgi:hypothetical protein